MVQLYFCIIENDTKEDPIEDKKTNKKQQKQWKLKKIEVSGKETYKNQQKIKITKRRKSNPKMNSW